MKNMLGFFWKLEVKLHEAILFIKFVIYNSISYWTCRCYRQYQSSHMLYKWSPIVAPLADE